MNVQNMDLKTLSGYMPPNLREHVGVLRVVHLDGWVGAAIIKKIQST